ncbi:MAG: 50S ribosomal protein L11 methyltransferase [Zoogloeaceae bacterium]|nr:50S ribosomal protein L11 methyltransferase [Zoogloeaceae bacterium]
MSFAAFSFLTDETSAERWCDALLEVGALSATIEDADAGTPEETPQFGEPGIDLPGIGWQRAKIEVLFAEDAQAPALFAEAAALAGFAALPELEKKAIPETDWVRQTQAQFDPIRISERLWIVPSWHTPPEPGALNLLLDPGMAFGTGSHPTTRLCLMWLEAQLTGHEAPQSLLDYGCGSGILAIAAAKLGAAPVVGIDIDPQAVEAAVANARKNQIEAEFFAADAPVEGQFDLLVANILSNPLKALAPALCARVKPGGKFALSGILVAQSQEIAEIYSPFAELSVFGEQEGWVCLEGTKK